MPYYFSNGYKRASFLIEARNCQNHSLTLVSPTIKLPTFSYSSQVRDFSSFISPQMNFKDAEVLANNVRNEFNSVVDSLNSTGMSPHCCNVSQYGGLIFISEGNPPCLNFISPGIDFGWQATGTSCYLDELLRTNSGTYLVNRALIKANTRIPTVTATAGPSPLPNTTVNAQPNHDTSLTNQLKMLQTQLDILQKQIRKICSSKPKPKGC